MIGEQLFRLRWEGDLRSGECGVWETRAQHEKSGAHAESCREKTGGRHPHPTLSQRARASGLGDHVWTIKELIEWAAAC